MSNAEYFESYFPNLYKLKKKYKTSIFMSPTCSSVAVLKLQTSKLTVILEG